MDDPDVVADDVTDVDAVDDAVLEAVLVTELDAEDVTVDDAVVTAQPAKLPSRWPSIASLRIATVLLHDAVGPLRKPSMVHDAFATIARSGNRVISDTI